MPPIDEKSRLEVPERFGRPWLRSDHPVARQVVRPLESFARTEAGSGSILLMAAIAALVWSNAASGSYDDFWTTAVVVEVGSLTFEEDFRHLVNDLLMALFFYVVCLEVKREVLFGALREGGSAGVPVAAALGTMVGSAVVYSAVNVSGGDLSGWAVPIATDIAFVLAVVGVAGHRVPRELRAFMLTLAVVDDLGTIAVIAIFFGESISLAWLTGAVGVVLVVLLMQRLGVRLLFPYVLLAGLLWLAVFESGLHATIAGVVLGFLTPAVTFYSRDETSALIADQLRDIRAAGETDEVGEATMQETSRMAHEAVSPLVRMETALHPWSAFVVLPIFALANAGVPLSLSELGDAVTSQIGFGVMLGLVIGAPLGGILFAWGVSRIGGLPLPRGLDWSSVVAGTPLKGIGFTVAIFLAVLAFDDPAKVDQAKLSILLASAIAAAIGLTAIALRYRSVRSRNEGSR